MDLFLSPAFISQRKLHVVDCTELLVNREVLKSKKMVLFGSSLSSSCLRRKRKWWPHHLPYKGKWQQTFNEQQAMESLQKTAAKEGQNHGSSLLSALINTFHINGCDPNPTSYSFLVNTLCRRSLFCQLPPVLDRLEKIEKFETPESIFTDLIRRYGDAGLIQDAIDIFFRIPNFRCTPSVNSLNCLLSVLCKRKESLALVYDVLMRSLDLKIRLEGSSFQVLVRALCRYGKPISAIELLNSMERHGCIPDLRMYLTILSSLCKHASSVEVLDFMEKMKKAGLTPTVLGFTEVVNALVRESRANEAFDVLKWMKREGVKPDIVSYTSVLNGFFSAGEFQKGEELFDEILIMGLVPDCFTYSVYINGLCKQQNFDCALKFLVSMEEMGCKPNVVVYNVLMVAFCKAGDIQRVSEVLILMHSKGVEGNSHTYGILIDLLLANGKMFSAFVALVEMLDRGFVPRPSTFSLMVCRLCEHHLTQEALHVLEEMVQRTIVPGVKAWEALLLSPALSDSCNKTKLDVQGLEQLID